MESRFPVLTIGSRYSASINAICLAKVDSINTSPLLGPVCVNILVTTTFKLNASAKYFPIRSVPTFEIAYGEAG